MKRWLKKYGKYLIISLGGIFIANGIYGVFTAVEDWKVIFHGVGIVIWLVVIGIYSGAFSKFYEWWEKD